MPCRPQGFYKGLMAFCLVSLGPLSFQILGPRLEKDQTGETKTSDPVDSLIRPARLRAYGKADTCSVLSLSRPHETSETDCLLRRTKVKLDQPQSPGPQRPGAEEPRATAKQWAWHLQMCGCVCVCLGYPAAKDVFSTFCGSKTAKSDLVQPKVIKSKDPNQTVCVCVRVA